MTDYREYGEEEYQYDYDEECDEIGDEVTQAQIDIYKENIRLWAKLVML